MELKKLVFKHNGKDISLTPEEARQLYYELKQVFDNGQTYYYPVYPTYPQVTWGDKWTITCSDNLAYYHTDTGIQAISRGLV